jgi:hypothetical protein
LPAMDRRTATFSRPTMAKGRFSGIISAPASQRLVRRWPVRHHRPSQATAASCSPPCRMMPAIRTLLMTLGSSRVAWPIAARDDVVLALRRSMQSRSPKNKKSPGKAGLQAICHDVIARPARNIVALGNERSPCFATGASGPLPGSDANRRRTRSHCMFMEILLACQDSPAFARVPSLEPLQFKGSHCQSLTLEQ